MDKTWKPELRKSISKKVRELRKGRRFTQADLAARLGLSQARLSIIEKGEGSFSAEQLLEILRIFNVPAQVFADSKRDPQGDIQNALVRLGASHLVEDADLLPSEHLEEVEAAIREVLLDGHNPRQVSALAPVIAKHHARLNLTRLWARFVDYGLENRLGWALENIAEALHTLARSLTSLEAAPLRKAEATLRNFLARRKPNQELDSITADLDLFDSKALSAKTIDGLWKNASPASRRWAVVSALQPKDFVEALRASGSYRQPRTHDTI